MGEPPAHRSIGDDALSGEGLPVAEDFAGDPSSLRLGELLPVDDAWHDVMEGSSRCRGRSLRIGVKGGGVKGRICSKTGHCGLLFSSGP